MAKEKKSKAEKSAENITDSKKSSGKGKNSIVSDSLTELSKKPKQDKIALQNMLFGTEEKKLMVSDTFLNDMTVKYISRRMKVINSDYESIHTTKSAENFFKYCDEILARLDELITLEPFHTFKNPKPSIFKRNFENHKPAATTAMLHRIWKNAVQKYNASNEDGTPNDKAIACCDEAINTMLNYREFLSDEDMTVIDGFYKQIHGEELDMDAPADKDKDKDEGAQSVDTEDTSGSENTEDSENPENQDPAE
jgi:hypothetical protein